MNLKVLCQNIVNNPSDFTTEKLEQLFNDFANQFKPSLVSEGEINKMAEEYIKKEYGNFASPGFINNRKKNYTDGLKQGLQYTNQSDNSGKVNEDLEVGFANWIRDNKWSPGNHYQNSSMWYHNFKPTSTTKDLFKEYLTSIKQG